MRTPGDDWGGEWFAIRTRSRHEKKVRDELTRRSVEVFLPTYQRWSRWRDRLQRIEWPLFPGYCFGRFLLGERLTVLRIPGVVGLVGAGRGPEPVGDGEIESVRRLVQSELPYDPHPFLREGMEVEIVRGPLVGVRGLLLRKDRRLRLVVSVTLIHQAAAVEVHPADVVVTTRLAG